VPSRKKLKNNARAGQEKIDKMDKHMRDIFTSQDELKTDISVIQGGVKENEISGVNNYIEDKIVDRVSDMETKINADQEELRREISAFQDKINAARLNLKRG
jgi:gas vesicle protein